MLVYGDHIERLALSAKAAQVADLLREAEATPTGVGKHAALVRAFVEAGALGQGVLDAEFARQGLDRHTARAEHIHILLLRLAAEIAKSSRQKHAAAWRARSCLLALAKIGLGADNARIPFKAAEGFAHYAVYPETYLSAANGLPPQCMVIGLRGIGLPLAAIAAIGANTRRMFSLRPVGHPFDRRIFASGELQDAVRRHKNDFAVVDEGPGLSGSSFIATSEFLRSCGASMDRIHFLPSHSGDLGPRSSALSRQRWRCARRHIAEFDDVFALRERRTSLASWVADITGNEPGGVEDISAGRWRALRHAPDAYPPCFPQQERRKYLVRGPTGAYLLKFNGLGAYGAVKAAQAHALADAGFSPNTFGERYGFLVSRWVDGAHAWSPTRGELIEHLAAYLSFRMQRFSGGEGASLSQLLQMATHNAAESLGEGAAKQFARWKGVLDALQRRCIPMAVDGRLHAWEWLCDETGRALKTDAVDHHATHDLIGCQDISWDIAGAVTEFQLDDAERKELLGRLRRAQSVDPALIDVMLPCYAAFQVGLWTSAADRSNSLDRDGAHAQRARYERTLARLLSKL